MAPHSKLSVWPHWRCLGGHLGTTLRRANIIGNEMLRKATRAAEGMVQLRLALLTARPWLWQRRCPWGFTVWCPLLSTRRALVVYEGPSPRPSPLMDSVDGLPLLSMRWLLPLGVIPTLKLRCSSAELTAFGVRGVSATPWRSTFEAPSSLTRTLTPTTTTSRLCLPHSLLA